MVRLIAIARSKISLPHKRQEEVPPYCPGLRKAAPNCAFLSLLCAPRRQLRPARLHKDAFQERDEKPRRTPDFTTGHISQPTPCLTSLPNTLFWPKRKEATSTILWVVFENLIPSEMKLTKLTSRTSRILKVPCPMIQFSLRRTLRRFPGGHHRHFQLPLQISSLYTR